MLNTRWFKYDRDWFLCKQAAYVPVIFEPPCSIQRWLNNETAKERAFAEIVRICMDPIKLNIHRKSNRCQLFRVACKLLTEILPMSWKNTHTTKEDYSEKLMKTFTYDSKLPKCFRFVTCAEKLDHFGNGHKTGKPNIY